MPIEQQPTNRDIQEEFINPGFDGSSTFNRINDITEEDFRRTFEQIRREQSRAMTSRFITINGTGGGIEEQILADSPQPYIPYEEKDKFVYTVEEPKIKVSKEECVFIHGLGYYKKDDKRLLPDYLYKGFYTILDSRFKNVCTEVYDDINENGELLFKYNYTNEHTQQYPSKNGVPKIIKLPKIIDLSKGKSYLITQNLINNKVFKEYYTENISDGFYYSNKDVKINNMKDISLRQLKIHYRKYKSPTGEFLNSIKNIPNTFINTLGKRYQFGVEIETISGTLPQHLDSQLYYSAVHDGSLRDVETGETYGKLK